MAGHDWAGRLAAVAATKFAGVRDSEMFGPFAFRRPDGSVATAFGHTRCLIVVGGHHVPAPAGALAYNEPPAPNRKVCGKVLDRVLADLVVQPVGTSTVGEVRGRLGVEPPELDPEPACPDCNGRGTVECFHCEQDMDCEGCDGTGRVRRQADVVPRLVRVAGRNFDAFNLARLLAAAPDGPVRVSAGEPRPALLVLRLAGDGWEVIAAGYSALPEEHELVELPLAAGVPA